MIFNGECMKKGVMTLIALLMILSSVRSEQQAVDEELDVMIGQMIMVGFRGLEVDESSRIIEQIKRYHLGGIILFDYDVQLGIPVRNIDNPQQLAELTAGLQKASTIPLFIAVDQEGGRVNRLKERHGFRTSCSAGELGKKNDLALTEQTAVDIASGLSSVGINLNLAPVADVDVNPDNPAIGRLERSFSSSPVTVGFHAEAYIEGLRSGNILSCIKHFPGHGSAFNDSHYGLTDITDSWSEEELLPYRYLIGKNKVDMIMTGHLFHEELDSDHPATLSRYTLTQLLRDELGFDGIIITDDMNMQAITDHYGLEEAVLLALQADVDILLYANNMEYDPEIAVVLHDYVKSLVEQGLISKEKIIRSYRRIKQIKDLF